VTFYYPSLHIRGRVIPLNIVDLGKFSWFCASATSILSIYIGTPDSAPTPSSSASPNKRPATVLDLDRVPNIRYFRGHWLYVEDVDRLDWKLSWEAVNGTGIVQLYAH
jgi:hypothetical protein